MYLILISVFIGFIMVYFLFFKNSNSSTKKVQEKKRSITDFSYKICLFGNSRVGKAAIVYRFVDNQFSETSVPLHQVKRKTINLNNGRSVALTIEVGNQTVITDSFLRGSDGLIIVVDHETTVEQLEELYQKAQNLAAKKTAGGKVVIGIVVNKCDLLNPNPDLSQSIKQICQKHDLFSTEVSAKTGDGIQTLMEEFANKIYEIKSNL
eukprot:TRINITY_DN58_c0_g1_i2.p1 TRINITY_DN58_c0_g1~~TRINITY_DN58_c0_g1_i2.p1  ORF type:complete len:208 (-),score=43.18 TRINITY_DN58_c0_g1_i2:89-712(-)